MEQHYSDKFPGYEAMAQASFVLAILAFFTSRILLFPMIFASLSILFAILSKGFRLRLVKKARIAIGIAIAALLLNGISTVQTVHKSLELFKDPDFQQEFNKVYEEFYGAPYDDPFQLFGGEDL